MSFRASILVSLFLLSSQIACAHPIAGLKRGADLGDVSVEEIAREIPKGSILVLGENHGLSVHRAQHMAVLRELRAAGHRVSVGLEFFSFAFQNDVDLWREGRLSEVQFLQKIGWGQPSFDFYRSQASFPRVEDGGRTLALNASRTLTAKVAKLGLLALSPEEKAELPPNFSLGRDSYRVRFLELMPHLPDASAGERYFAAQSIWDDTMAWRAAEFLNAHPEQTLVIVVGDFHAQFGGGLPDRLKARTRAPVFVLSQVNLSGLSNEAAAVEFGPSPRDGQRADWIWAEEAVD